LQLQATIWNLSRSVLDKVSKIVFYSRGT